MKIFFCPVCKTYTRLRLMPDFSSSGLWCEHCGVGFADPDNELPFLSQGLVDLIDGWVLLWDLASQMHRKLNIENVNKKIIAMGKELERQINQYYECYLDEDCSKICCIE